MALCKRFLFLSPLLPIELSYNRLRRNNKLLVLCLQAIQQLSVVVDLLVQLVNVADVLQLVEPVFERLILVL